MHRLLPRYQCEGPRPGRFGGPSVSARRWQAAPAGHYVIGAQIMNAVRAQRVSRHVDAVAKATGIGDPSNQIDAADIKRVSACDATAMRPAALPPTGELMLPGPTQADRLYGFSLGQHSRPLRRGVQSPRSSLVAAA
jgi:hypothetical protein